MKKIFYSSLMMSVLLLVASCTKDLLDKENLNELSTSSFWQNESDAMQGITATYAALQSARGDKWTWFEEMYIATEYKTDLINNNKAEGYGKSLQSFTYTTDESSFTNLWHSNYAGIFRANQCIENIPNIPVGLTDGEKNALVAEAKFLRAYYHFTLLSYFQNIALITSVPVNEEEYYPAQSSEAAVLAQIESDLMDAISGLPESRDSENLGRATKYTAKAYLGKVYLFQEKWVKASDEFSDVILSNKYNLLDNYEDNFNGNSENGPESVFEIQFSGIQSNGNDERNVMAWEVASYEMGGWELFYPSDWLMKELKNDKKANGEYSDRVYGTMFFDDPKSKTEKIDEQGTFKFYSEVKANLNHHVFFRKYASSNQVPEVSSYYTGINIHLMRYADVLLMQAESLNEQGLTSEATILVNKVRNRSNAADIPLMTKDNLRKQIRHHERPAELSMEYTIRWTDLYRWSRGSNAENISTVMTNHEHEKAGNFVDGKHDIFPIPLSEMSKNPNMNQNPNW